MSHKEKKAFLDTVAPGWADSDNPLQFVKTIDPKDRRAAALAVWWIQNNPKKPTTKKAPKAPTPKEG